MDDNKEVSNLKINGAENVCLVSVNSSIYHLDVIYSAAYVFLDRAYVLLDGDPYEKIIVELKPKIRSTILDLEKLGREFNNELLNYSNYKRRAEESMEVRNILLQRALLTNAPDTGNLTDLKDDLDNMDSDLETIDDPDGIAIPWEEKYGKKSKENADGQ